MYSKNTVFTNLTSFNMQVNECKTDMKKVCSVYILYILHIHISNIYHLSQAQLDEQTMFIETVVPEAF